MHITTKATTNAICTNYTNNHLYNTLSVRKMIIKIFQLNNF